MAENDELRDQIGKAVRRVRRRRAGGILVSGGGAGHTILGYGTMVDTK